MAVGDVSVKLNNALPKRSARFDGVNDYIDVGNFQAFNGATEISVSAWIKVMDLDNDGTIMNTDVFGGGAQFLFYYDTVGSITGRTHIISLILNDVNGNVRIEGATNSLNDSQWHMVTMTFKSGSSTGLRMYIDAVEDPNSPVDASGTGALKTVLTNMALGSASGGGAKFINGSIADVRIYNKALSASEITDLYAGKNIIDGLISNWKLDFDYTDSVGSNTGTNYGSQLGAVDGVVGKAVADARVSANDKYMISIINDKVLTTQIEEA